MEINKRAYEAENVDYKQDIKAISFPVEVGTPINHSSDKTRGIQGIYGSIQQHIGLLYSPFTPNFIPYPVTCTNLSEKQYIYCFSERFVQVTGYLLA